MPHDERRASLRLIPDHCQDEWPLPFLFSAFIPHPAFFVSR